MNVQRNLIRELILYEFELGHKAAEATKNIRCAKGEDAVDHSTVTRWFKKFRSGCKNLDDQARSGRPKTVDSEAVFQAIEANPKSSTRKVSGELGISQSSVVRRLHDLGKSISELPNCASLIDPCSNTEASVNELLCSKTTQDLVPFDQPKINSTDVIPSI